MKALANSSINFFFVLLSIYVASFTTSLPIGNFAFWITVDILFIVAIFVLKPIYGKEKIFLLTLLLLWVFIGFFRGTLVADGYWEWKPLVRYSLTMLTMSIAYLATNERFVEKFLRYWYKYGLWLVFAFMPFLNANDFYGTYLAPVMLLLLLFPILPMKWKVITLIFTSMVFLAGFDSRSNIIRFFMASALGMIYFFPIFRKEFLLKIIHAVLLIAPILLLLLALSGIFNVFKIDQYFSENFTYKDSQAGKAESLTADTRTGLYVENIMSALKNDYVVLGRTPAKGYDSEHFGGFSSYVLGTGKKVRYASEVSMLNIFTWYGIIGVVLYSFIFLVASYLALYRSRNYFIKVIGVFVAFRWAYAFVEEFNRVDVQMVLLWVLIGMCYSSIFRSMSNTDFKHFIRKMLPNIRF